MGNKISDDYDVVVNEAQSNTSVNTDSDAPEYGSAEWNAYVMSKFTSEELIDGNPLCHGLRRVAVELLGDIVSSKPVQVFPSLDPNGVGRATVVYEIIFNWRNEGEFRTFGDVAEVWHGNTEDLFAAHAAATACTKAEGRVLRKALMVKCLAAEELTQNKNVAEIVRSTLSGAPSTGEMSKHDLISDAQLNFINGKCKQLDINVLAYLKSNNIDGMSGLKKTKKAEASNLIQGINKYQSSPVPEELQGYNPNWGE